MERKVKAWVVVQHIVRSTKTPLQEPQMDMTTLLIIVVVVLLLGGGGWYGRGRWYGRP